MAEELECSAQYLDRSALWQLCFITPESNICTIRRELHQKSCITAQSMPYIKCIKSLNARSLYANNAIHRPAMHTSSHVQLFVAPSPLAHSHTRRRTMPTPKHAVHHDVDCPIFVSYVFPSQYSTQPSNSIFLIT